MELTSHYIVWVGQPSITTYHKIAWYSISPFSHWFTNSQSTANHQSSWPIFDPSETQPSLYQLHSLVCFSSPRRPTCGRFYHLEVNPNWISQTNHSNSSLVAISRSNQHLVRRETTKEKNNKTNLEEIWSLKQRARDFPLVDRFCATRRYRSHRIRFAENHQNVIASVPYNDKRQKNLSPLI